MAEQARALEPATFEYQVNDQRGSEILTPLRIIERDGESWFVAKDVVAGLGLSNPAESLKVLDDDEKSTHTLNTPGGPQSLTVISEPGFYKLVGRSRKPAARRFDRWVRHEVLPQIRQTGGYNSSTVSRQEFNRLVTVLDKLSDVLLKDRGQPKPLASDDAWARTVIEWADAQAEPFRLIEMFPEIDLKHGMGTDVSRKGHERRIANILRAHGYANQMGRRPGCRRHTTFWSKTDA